MPTAIYSRTVRVVAIGDPMPSRRADDTTIGEVFRRLVDMDERYEKKLDRIEEQVRLTNGRTTRLEERVDQLRYSQQHPITPPVLPSVPITTNEGESLSIKASVSPKMWAAIISGAGAVWVVAQMIANYIMGGK